MSEAGTMAADMAARLFNDLFWPDGVRATAVDWDQRSWDRIEESGLTLALVSEAAGGFGPDRHEALDLVRIAGAAAVPLPFAETMIVNWLLAEAGIAMPSGAVSMAIGGDSLRLDTRDGASLTGEITRVPWGRSIASVVVLVEVEGKPFVALLPRGTFRVSQVMQNHAGEPRDTLVFDGAAPSAIVPLPALAMRDVVGCAVSMRTIAMAGAIEAILDRSVAYAGERVQFGRPIAGFQAIQHQLAVMAGQWAMASAAAQLAADAFGDPQKRSVTAAAKVVADEAAGTVAAIAHQVHGAIGFSREHPLHVFTSRLWSWRDDYGNGAHWSREIGRSAIAAGADALWPMIVGERGAHGAA